MIFKRICRGLFAGILLANTLGFAEKIEIDTAFNLPEQITKQIAGKAVYKASFVDDSGKHVLVLTRSFVKNADGNEIITLKAQQFTAAGSLWRQEWIIKDFMECENLDLSGEFINSLTTFTDLDSNRVVETTVAYFLICAGGVDPKLTKVIMRQGEIKYAVRGESLVRIDPKTVFGGTYTADKILDTKPAFKAHLIKIWKTAAGVDLNHK